MLDPNRKEKVKYANSVSENSSYRHDLIRFLLLTTVSSLKSKGDRIDTEKFLKIMLERQKQLRLR